jgi:hypothetical protein
MLVIINESWYAGGSDVVSCTRCCRNLLFPAFEQSRVVETDGRI